MFQWIIDNKEWLFSGVGIVALTIVIGLFFKKKKKSYSNTKSMTQIGGDNSTNYQSSGDINIGTGDDR